MTASSALVWPVASPWALKRRGSSTAYLSGGQRALLWYVSLTLRRGDRTLAELARAVGVADTGQLHRELRRLRQLELLGYKARRGRAGWHRLWIPRSALRLRGSRLQGGNTVTSTPFGRFIGPNGLKNALRRDAAPPGAGGIAAGVGPRRGREPPHVLYLRCPKGHSIRAGRRSWMRLPERFTGTWQGVCRRCGGRPVRETVTLELVSPRIPRPLSPTELADPELRARRRREAERLVRDPSTPLSLREQLRRDYLD